MSVWTPKVFSRPLPKPRSKASGLYKLWRSWCDEITTPGKWLVATLLLSGLGTVTVQVPIYQLFCGLAVILIVSIAGGFMFFPSVTVTGSLPDRTTTGLDVVGKLTVKNTSWFRPAYDVNIGLFDLPHGLSENSQENTIRRLGVGESVEIAISVHAHRRGLYALPLLRAYTSFPFNLFRIGRPIRSMDSLLVLPSFHPVYSVDIPIGSKYQPGGIALTSNIGESPEYIGNREYIPGEPARRMDFRSWARLGTPVVREFQEEYYCRIALILDTWLPQKPRRSFQIPTVGCPQLEAAISLAASASDALSSGEYLVDLFAAGPELYVFQAGRHTAHFENILEILACVEPCESDPFDTIAPVVTEELQNVSAAICILLGWDSARKQLMQSIREAGCSLKVIIVSDQEPPDIADDFDFVQLLPEQIESGMVESL
jgi:uncharacterized protein (DUF58 family)